MPTHATSPLARLRRHRGLWALAVFVLLLKFASGTACLADGPRPGDGAAVPAMAQVDAASGISGPTSAADESGNCWLGEGDDCHCTCAHSMAVPAGSAVLPSVIEPFPVTPTLRPAWTQAVTGSLLRPPIA